MANQPQPANEAARAAEIETMPVNHRGHDDVPREGLDRTPALALPRQRRARPATAPEPTRGFRVPHQTSSWVCLTAHGNGFVSRTVRVAASGGVSTGVPAPSAAHRPGSAARRSAGYAVPAARRTAGKRMSRRAPVGGRAEIARRSTATRVMNGGAHPRSRPEIGERFQRHERRSLLLPRGRVRTQIGAAGGYRGCLSRQIVECLRVSKYRRKFIIEDCTVAMLVASSKRRSSRGACCIGNRPHLGLWNVAQVRPGSRPWRLRFQRL